ncbi:protein of unknown function [Xenorhabdus nematophila AN6/1]|nr:hypothetical protein XNA1_2020017 [Xenorhabdus nematophila str. Anatoliense]CEE93575.1 hypothetical protein XNA1_40017 [Xenorhabdus nematophila str. Anatoliense]CEF33270.1 hypothetical protein XNW1_4710007 [Xenorhabdus nematophila str. Websteri]CEK21228.1 protein of unknown function [Xenorhabdus nematophila AN6/1]
MEKIETIISLICEVSLRNDSYHTFYANKVTDQSINQFKIKLLI